MTILPIAQIGEPVLRTKTKELTLDEIHSSRWQTFMDDLVATMHHANGAGIAANQVFESVRVCTMHVKGNNPRYPYKPELPLTLLINPVLTILSEERFSNYEGCLSVPNLRGRVMRSPHVRVDYLDRQGESQSVEAFGITAGTYQHEIDHLDGYLFTDRVSDSTTFCTWDVFEKYHRAQFTKEAEAVVQKYGS